MDNLNAVGVDLIVGNAAGPTTGIGDMASRMLMFNGDVGAFRPYVEGYAVNAYGNVINPGTAHITRHAGGGKYVRQEVARNDATLLYDEWKAIDRTLDGVVETYRARLSAWNDLLTQTRPYRTPNGIGTMQVLTQTTTDPGDATISMSGDVEAANFRRTNSQTILPVPLIYSGFTLDVRELQASRAGSRALDLDQLEQCARRVLEAQDALTIGTTTFTGPGGTIQGYTSFTPRATGSITAPSGNFGPVLINDLNAMRQTLIGKKMYGPYMVYFGIGWDQYLDQDYSTLKGEGTVLERVLKLRDVKGAKVLPTLSGTQVLMVQMDSGLVRPVIGQDPVVVQWQTNGGMTLHYRVVACSAPQMRVDSAGNSGIVHYS